MVNCALNMKATSGPLLFGDLWFAPGPVSENNTLVGKSIMQPTVGRWWCGITFF